MQVNVLSDGKSFPIEIDFNGIKQRLTIMAAIELSKELTIAVELLLGAKNTEQAN
jgi:hypothetical protein